MYIVQTVLLKREKFSQAEAFAWARAHGYRTQKVDVTPEYYRFRQVDPSLLHHGRFRTIELGDDGYLVMFYSGKKDESK